MARLTSTTIAGFEMVEIRPEDPSLITAPAGIGPGDDGIDPRIGQVPVWVVGFFVPNASLQVKNLLPHGRY